MPGKCKLLHTIAGKMKFCLYDLPESRQLELVPGLPYMLSSIVGFSLYPFIAINCDPEYNNFVELCGFFQRITEPEVGF